MTKIIILLCFCVSFQNITFASENMRPNEPGPWPSMQVNTFTGNFFYQRNDLYIRAKGEFALDIFFSYNSLNNQHDQGYGNGWSFSFSMWYRIAGNTLTIGLEDGEEHIFTWNDSLYVPPVGIYDSVMEYSAGKFLLKTKHGILYYFDDPGHKQLTKVQDRNGNTITLSYSDGKPTIITDPSGRLLNLTWTGDHLSQLTDPNTLPARTINYIYDESLNLVQVIRPLSNSFLYSYDGHHNMISITDPRSNTVFISYNNHDAVSEMSCPAAGYSKLFSYENCDNTTTVSQMVSSVNRQTTYSFDQSGRITSIQYPDGNAINFTWDSQHNVINFTDENSNETHYTWDDIGNMLSVIDCLGHSESFTYEPLYNMTSGYTNKNGNTTTYSYDLKGNLSYLTDCNGARVAFNYDASGGLISKTDKNGYITTYTYDANGNLTGLLDPLGLSVTYTYDGTGNLMTFTDKRGFITSFSYDLLNRHIGTQDAMGFTSSYSYDYNGNQVSKTDQNGNTSYYSFDALNRLISSTNPLGGNTTYYYDAVGNLTSKTNPVGATTHYSYNRRNKIITIINALGYSKAFTFDAKGNNLTLTNEDGYTTTYEYDQLDRKISVINAAGGIKDYEYDNLGNITSITDEVGNTVQYNYDSLNRLSSFIHPTGGVNLFTYDAAGNLLVVTDPLGGTISYNYDLLNRKISRTSELNYTELNSYDANGNILSHTDETGRVVSYQYDALNRLVKIIRPSGGTTNLQYDNTGNLISKSEPNGVITVYSFDAENYLISASVPSDTSQKDIIITRNANHEIISWGNGEKGSVYLIRNILGQIIQRIEIKDTALCDSVSYVLNPNGKISAIFANSDTISYTYSPLGKKTSQNYNGDTIFFYQDISGRDSAIQYPNGTHTSYLRNGDGRIIQYLLRNLSGDTIRAITKTLDAAGNITSIVYDNNSYFTRVYNQADELTAEIYCNPSWNQYDTAEYVYLANGLPDQVIKNLNRSKLFSYNPDGNLNQMVTIENAVHDTLTCLIDSVGNRTEAGGSQNYKNSYDFLNRCKIHIGAGGDTTKFQYYDDGLPMATVSNGIPIYRTNLDGQSYQISTGSELLYTALPTQTTFNNNMTIYSSHDGEGNSPIQFSGDSQSYVIASITTNYMGEIVAQQGNWVPPGTLEVNDMVWNPYTGVYESAGGIASYDPTTLNSINQDYYGSVMVGLSNQAFNTKSLFSANTMNFVKAHTLNPAIFLSWNPITWIFEKIFGLPIDPNEKAKEIERDPIGHQEKLKNDLNDFEKLEDAGDRLAKVYVDAGATAASSLGLPFEIFHKILLKHAEGKTTSEAATEILQEVMTDKLKEKAGEMTEELLEHGEEMNKIMEAMDAYKEMEENLKYNQETK